MEAKILDNIQDVQYLDLFISDTYPIPVAEVQMYGGTYKAVLDTGAETCLFDKQIVLLLEHLHTIKREGGHTYITTPAGKKKSEFIKIPISVGGKEYKVVFNTCDLDFLCSKEHTIHILLGADFMFENGWKIDFENKRLWLK